MGGRLPGRYARCGVGHRAWRVRLGELPEMIGGTTDNGTPTVLADLADRRAPAPDSADGGGDGYRDELTDEMREANRHDLDNDDLVLLDPEPEPDAATGPTARGAALPGQWWNRSA